jgi:hypothetical protein
VTNTPASYFDEFGGDTLRSADKFLAFVSSRPDWFDSYAVPEAERVPLGHELELIDYLSAEPVRLVPGDIVVIFGWTPWDPRDRHYHSLFVYETDPMTGFPLLIAGNAGRPTIRTWHTEAVRTPRRYLVRRIRPRFDWLETLVEVDRGTHAAPAPIVEGS